MITIITEPAKFTPAENPVIFQFESDTPDIVYFRVELMEADTSAVINNLDVFTTPAYDNGSYVDFSRILSNTVRWHAENNLSDKFYMAPSEVFKYKLKITENTLTTGEPTPFVIDVPNAGGGFYFTITPKPAQPIVPADTLTLSLNNGMYHLTRPIASVTDYGTYLYCTTGVSLPTTPGNYPNSIVAVNGVLEVPEPVEMETDDFYVWNAKVEKLNFNYGYFNQFIITDNEIRRFLTYKPNKAIVNDYSFEQLFFLHNDETDLTVWLETFGSGNNGYNVNLTSEATNHMYALNVSPKAITEAWGNVLTPDITHYKIYVTNNNSRVTEERTYYIQDLECHLEPINLVWVNSLGGLDSYQFVNPQESLNVQRGTIKKNPYKITDGVYSDRNDDMFNVADEIYSANSSVTVKVWTKILSDEEVKWLSEMVSSKQLFVELSDRTLLPVNLVNTNYQYQRERYLRNEVNTMQFEFTLSENIIPALSNSSYILTRLYYNEERGGYFTRNTCIAGQLSDPVLFTVAANTYSSNISQDAANALADAAVAAGGQAYANANGICTGTGVFGNVMKSGVFRKNDCPAGQYGSEETYSVLANTYYAFSQSAADALAQADVDANGQGHANTIGICTVGFGNVYMDETFTTGGCTPPMVGTVVLYSVAANTYYAATQLDANDLAQDDIDLNGQNYADMTGLCVNPPEDIDIAVKYFVANEGGFDVVRAYCVASSMVHHDLTISWHGYVVAPAADYPLTDIIMSAGTSMTLVVDVCTVVTGEGANVIVEITNVYPDIPVGGTWVNYTW